MDRVFSNLTIRAVSEDERIIEGIASTPRPDRQLDVVESMGAAFELPIPFLLDHNALEAVGEVEAAEVTATGIKFRARVRKIAEPGPVKDLCDRAWSLLKNGLRKFVSIGFRPLDAEPLPSGGLRFTEWEWLELSACSVPANPDAKITGLKAARGSEQAKRDAQVRAAVLQRSIENGLRRKRLGIPAPIVTLTAADKAAGRKRLAARKAGKGVVKIGGAKPSRVVRL